ncbi:MAG: hypothetical protein WCT32_03280 [Patescibacteria group bacterium]|jgi:hypothetical protein
MTKQYRKHKNQQTVLESIVLGLFQLVASLFHIAIKGFRKRGGISTADKNEIVRRRLIVEAMLESNNIHELRQAVFEADKLVDHTLKTKGFDGDTFASRLRAAESSIDSGMYNQIWQGHKIRNQLAHEHDRGVDQYELRNAAEKLLRYIREL